MEPADTARRVELERVWWWRKTRQLHSRLVHSTVAAVSFQLDYELSLVEGSSSWCLGKKGEAMEPALYVAWTTYWLLEEWRIMLE